jgi:hypothetical protein
MTTDVEVSRAVNALSTTLRDQRPATLDPERLQRIADGALAGERKLAFRLQGPRAAELVLADDGRRVGAIARRDGQWTVTREEDASGSGAGAPA